mmetsp:Transcript_33876/g.96867  ORF Transcript_33876/g.96867 Transcript_33876/m.96867 type:complete len:258 (-) Transcript_33876:90-863(-)
MAFLSPGELRVAACCSRPCYRATRMPHLLPQALSYGVTTIAVEQVEIEEMQRGILLFSFENDVPDDIGLCKFIGFYSPDDLDAGISTRWLPVCNFRVPFGWISKSVRQVQDEEEFSICGISRRGAMGDSTHEIWFPNPFESFDMGDEVILSMQSAYRFTARHCPSAPARDARDAALVHGDFPWELAAGRSRLPPGELGLSFNWQWLPGEIERMAEVMEEDEEDDMDIPSVTLRDLLSDKIARKKDSDERIQVVRFRN